MAIPAILQQLGRNSMMQRAGQIKQMMQMVRNSGNPQAVLNMLAANNPEMKQVMDLVNQYGGDSIRALNETAKQMGINPDEILNMLR